MVSWLQFTFSIKADCVMLSPGEINPGSGRVLEGSQLYWVETHLGAFSAWTDG